MPMTLRIGAAPALGLVLLVVLASACGSAGTWIDDPANWSRAFQIPQPQAVVVLHSKYWRSSHWTLEYEFFFELAPNAPFKEQLIAKYMLRRLNAQQAAKARQNQFGPAPAWFAPRKAIEYEVWIPDPAAASNFMILVDKKSGAMFLTDYQV